MRLFYALAPRAKIWHIYRARSRTSICGRARLGKDQHATDDPAVDIVVCGQCWTKAGKPRLPRAGGGR